MSLMFKRCFFVVCLCFMLLVPLLAVQGEKKLLEADYSKFSIDAHSLALSGSGLSLNTNPTSSIDSNPANFVSAKNIGFSTPYVSFVFSNPGAILKHYDEHSMWATTIKKGFTPLAELVTGFEGRFKNFAFDLSLKDGLYSYAESEEKAGREASVINVTNLKFGVAAGYKKYWAWNFSLSFGIYSALDMEARTNVWNAGSLSDIVKNDELKPFITEGANYFTSVKIPVSFGFTLEVPYGFAFAGVVKNPTLLASENYLNNSGNELLSNAGNGAHVFEFVSKMKHEDNWTGDVGFSWDSSRILRAFGSRLAVSVDVIDVRVLFTYPETWIDHVKVGTEFAYKNISLRAGWQLSGFSFGLGLDLSFVKFDLSYNHVMTTGNENYSPDYFAPLKNSQLAFTLRFGK